MNVIFTLVSGNFKKARAAFGLAVFLGLVACGAPKPTEQTLDQPAPPKVENTHLAAKAEQIAEDARFADPLGFALAGEWRGKDKERDIYRHPRETLTFFDVQPDQNVIEIWPGGGWYSAILAPYAQYSKGKYTAVLFGKTRTGFYIRSNERFLKKFVNTKLFGNVNIAYLDDKSAPFAKGTADRVLVFRNVHSFMRNDMTQKAMSDFYTALKPGGVLGIVGHRLSELKTQDPKASTGYAQVSYVKTLAAEAGFEFVGASEINANPKDMADHPFGVWTLPPVSRKPKADDKREFDADKYLAIGESDRFTLKFRKP